MSNWIPTNELRFVERGRYEDAETILQQKWKHNEASYYGGRIVSEEWRDVPVVEEEE
jgi:hypothetical protein